MFYWTQITCKNCYTSLDNCYSLWYRTNNRKFCLLIWKHGIKFWSWINYFTSLKILEWNFWYFDNFFDFYFYHWLFRNNMWTLKMYEKQMLGCCVWYIFIFLLGHHINCERCCFRNFRVCTKYNLIILWWYWSYFKWLKWYFNIN